MKILKNKKRIWRQILYDIEKFVISKYLVVTSYKKLCACRDANASKQHTPRIVFSYFVLLNFPQF